MMNRTEKTIANVQSSCIKTESQKSLMEMVVEMNSAMFQKTSATDKELTIGDITMGKWKRFKGFEIEKIGPGMFVVMPGEGYKYVDPFDRYYIEKAIKEGVEKLRAK